MQGAAILLQNDRQAEVTVHQMHRPSATSPRCDNDLKLNPSQEQLPLQTGNLLSVQYPLTDDEDDDADSRLSAPHLQTNPSDKMDRIDSAGASSSSHVGKGKETRADDRTSRFGRGRKQQSTVGASHSRVPRFNLDNYRAWVRRQKKKSKDNTWSRLEKGFEIWYQRWVIERLLRQYPLPSSNDGRHIPLTFGDVRKTPLRDERRGGSKTYLSNFIRSSRYTIWSFIPKQLYFQFSKLANFYFLVIGILQLIPGLSTTGTWTTIGPLIAFVAFSMAKEGFDDYRRYMLDKSENRSKVLVLDPARTVSRKMKGKRHVDKEGDMVMTELDDIRVVGEDAWSTLQWQDLRVGDVIRLRRDQAVPADIILLHATGHNGVAYIDTMALDGETNLKSKQACPLLAHRCDTLAKIKTCNAEVVSEDPNLDLYNYEGRITVDGETMPLTMNEVVYRGSTLRNTTHATGLVINTGEECKIRINANKEVHAKMPAMQYKINRIVVLLVVVVVLLSIGETVGNEIWKASYEPTAWYLSPVPLKEILIGFIILFNTLIPLSLIVSLEIIKIGQFFLMQDAEMYDPETNTPMVANTTTILENLGQVSYVFSDKTGTLTENKMQFRKLSVAGSAWLHDMDVKRSEEQELSVASKGKTKQHHHMPPLNEADEPVKAPLIIKIHETRSSQARRPSSGWMSMGQSSHPESEPNTESLVQYIHQNRSSAFSKRTRQFLLCVALCHTCLPETKGNGSIEFQAASPDELALVQAAKDLGYVLVDRPTQSIVLQVKNADGSTSTETYQVLDVIEFSSRRKRMSIIVRMPDGGICVICKGADNVILPRLRLAPLAMQKSSEVERRASKRKSTEATNVLRRRSTQHSMDTTFAASTDRPRDLRRSNVRDRSSVVMDEVATWLDNHNAENFKLDVKAVEESHHNSRMFRVTSPTSSEGSNASLAGIVDESLAADDEAIFERCFQHIEEFASDGLRTLLYGYRSISEDEYGSWKKVYQQATTSLVDRQKRIEEAGEMIEQGFELAGATAIEDKLQAGVPETIDKLRRANIKVWMLTGDKRETAINIAHSARICKPFSELSILDASLPDLQDTLVSVLGKVSRGAVAHSVLVIDGHTLGVIDDDDTLQALFFDLAVRVDAVICCRASPSQKANLVKCIREEVPSSLTLAIGDGANDIAMIQASHVGIGISGREGLQAARISDYSIAQFRFLQRLLFVHGRWNYLRTSKYVLATFWKEMLFYIVQAQYQHWNGYTGTSLYESSSLTVFNTLFTSLCVILPGIFEKDLQASTLLAVPELYTYGQLSKGFNFSKYLAWTFVALVEAVIIYSIVYAVYRDVLFTTDNNLFAFGQLVFTICVVFINTKLFILEMHHKTIVTSIGWLLTVGGWFAFNLFISGTHVISPVIGPYPVQGDFIHNFGRQLLWWVTVLLALSAVIVLELCITSLRRVYFPTDQDLWQEMEHLGAGDVLKHHATGAAERGEASQAGGAIHKMDSAVDQGSVEG